MNHTEKERIPQQEQPEINSGIARTESTSAVETQPAAEEKASRPSFFQRAMYFLFGKEGKVGRVLRPILRYAALIVGMFALGMLSTYVFFYQPQSKDLKQTRNQLETVQVALNTAQADLQQAQKDLKKGASDLEAATTRSQVLDILSKVNTIRYAVSAGDKAAATTALEAAQSSLEKLLPILRADNAEVAEAIQNRLDLVAKEINRDPKTAQADLALLVETLQNLANAR